MKRGSWGRRAAALAIVLALTATTAAKCAPGAYGQPGHRKEHRYARQVFGNDPTEQGCLAALWDRESGWDPYATNANSGAYGIPQALPSVHGHPYAAGDWRAQIRWGHRYITRRYGDPCTAWAHEQAAGWY
jgi:hypothetical protein